MDSLSRELRFQIAKTSLEYVRYVLLFVNKDWHDVAKSVPRNRLHRYKNWYLCAGAVHAKSLNLLVWFREYNCPWSGNVSELAVEAGNMQILRYVRANGCPVNYDSFRQTKYNYLIDDDDTPRWEVWLYAQAMRAGSLELLKYACECGCVLDAKACIDAAKGGYLELLQYAHEHGCVWDEKTCASAAKYGHLEILKYLREKGCPWDKETCLGAARGPNTYMITTKEIGIHDSPRVGGNLEVLKYAYENGCPRDQYIYVRTVMFGGTKSILNYLEEMGANKSTWEDLLAQLNV